MAIVAANKLVSGSISNFINGVSQQPFALRLASQAEEQINAHSSVVEGLTKRPPSRFVARIVGGSIPSNAHIHIINRDLNEKYVAVFTPGSAPRVFTFDGVEKTVATPNGIGYLSSSNLRCVTIADYTFILNRDFVTAIGGTIKAKYPEAALIYIRQGNYNTNYQIVANGGVYQFKTSPTDPDTIQTEYIASQLALKLNTTSGGVFSASVFGSTVGLTRAGLLPFTVRTHDGLGDTAMIPIKGKVQSFAGLPAKAVVGYQVEVTGAGGNTYDNYYVEYTNQPGMDTAFGGVWLECAQPGRVIDLNPSTMPHVLVREASGNFTFKQATWDMCQAGDENTNPRPSFIGKKITDMFFFRNRLGFIADENVVMSRSGKFFNFWKATATDLLDSDPIDIAVSHTKVSILRHAIPFNEALLLFSDQTQFKLTSGEVLTPSTVSVNQTTEFETANTAKPVGAGKFVFFGTSKGGFSGVREYYVDANSTTNDANDVTAHVPEYIPGNIRKFASSTNQDCLLALSDVDLNSIYVYKYYYSSDTKVQSSWSKWTFPNVSEIMDMAFIESTLWMIVKRSNGLYLEKIELATGVKDSGLDYTILLDHRIPSSMTSVLIPSVSGEDTIITVPLPDVNDWQAIALPGDAVYKPGQNIPVLASGPGGAMILKGHPTNYIIGKPYQLYYLFSPLVLRQDAPGGGQTAKTDGRLQLRRMSVNYADTGFMRFAVTPHGRDTYNSVFTGRILGSSQNILGYPSLETGVFKFALMSNNLTTKIELINDTPFPTRIMNATWEAMYTVRSRSADA